MCSSPVVVIDVLRQNLSKMPFADHHDVVQAFTSNRANHPLRIGVLPRRAGRNDRLLKLQRLGLARKAVSITEKDPRRLITRAIRLGGGAGAEARPVPITPSVVCSRRRPC